MQAYKVPQRRVSANIFTPCGWLFGFFHIGKQHSFLESLNSMHTFLKLTDVELAETEECMEFFALHRNAALLIIPNEEESRLQTVATPADTCSQPVTAMLDVGLVHGELWLMPDIRLSDFLMNCAGFFVMRNCVSELWEDRSSGAPEQRPVMPVVLLNAHQVIGITELGPS